MGVREGGEEGRQSGIARKTFKRMGVRKHVREIKTKE